MPILLDVFLVSDLPVSTVSCIEPIGSHLLRASEVHSTKELYLEARLGSLLEIVCQLDFHRFVRAFIVQLLLFPRFDLPDLLHKF